MISMEQRKVQITGGNSYIVSLPREWITSTHIDKGDYVGVEANEDGTITIYPKSVSRKKRSYVIELTPTPSLNNRLIISKYLEGYDVIEVISKERIPKLMRKEIINTVRNLIGLEIFEETANKFTISSLIEFGSIKIDKILRRIIILTDSIYSESITALRENNKEFAQEIMPREDEVDKFYFHGLRELSEASRTPQMLKEMGINRSTDILSYQSVIKSVERTADYLIDILELFIADGSDVPEEILTYAEHSYRIFKEVTTNLFARDLTKANRFLDELKVEEKNLPDVADFDTTSLRKASAHAKMLDYYLRILRHCSNMSEITINLAV